MTPDLAIAELWQQAGFTPNSAQRDAILHTDGPLYLPAGPGSGKTRVLLWRTLNLIVFHQVKPEQIYLSTFTEKAALQLQEGLQALLGKVTNQTGQPYDVSQMYVGTVHSLCQRLLTDRRFAAGRQRLRPPVLLDELGQYFHLYRTRNWNALLDAIGLTPDNDGTLAINQALGKATYPNKHQAVIGCQAFFNRLSEECIRPEEALALIEAPAVRAYLDERTLAPEHLGLLLRLYAQYVGTLQRSDAPLTDFSLLQQEAHRVLSDYPGAGQVFRHVIVDEYQDTNTIQERLFFRLAEGTRNICVVGDDDQALYRFRGATVENFVQFPRRCVQYLGIEPRAIPLVTNYRSRQPIVEFCTEYMERCHWDGDNDIHYRVPGKHILAHRQDPLPAVVATDCGSQDNCCGEIANLVADLLRRQVVADPNQIAFLYPSLKAKAVGKMIEALQERGLKVYAPRAGRFLEVPEAVEMLGLLAVLFGREGLGGFNPEGHGDWTAYRTWLKNASDRAEEIIAEDPRLGAYIQDRRQELDGVLADHEALMAVVQAHGWDLTQPYDLATMKRPLLSAAGLSRRAQNAFSTAYFDRAVERALAEGRPATLIYVVRRATTVDWSVLDVFYRLCGMDHFRAMFDLAQRGEDEGPICNLSMISQFLARFMEEYLDLIGGEYLRDHLLTRMLFGSFFYALWRLGESEFENREDPFPRGRIPFLTIHQAKGLEFPVVVLPYPRKVGSGPQPTEVMVRPFLTRIDAEPLDRVADFDAMRVFYVALSRAQNLLVIGRYQGRGQVISEPIKSMLPDLPTVQALDLDTIPKAKLAVGEDLPRTYSYTGDYLAYQRCPRQYMIFRKYGFEASQTRTLFFGSLVHRTLDDLHNHLIALRESGAAR